MHLVLILISSVMILIEFIVYMNQEVVGSKVRMLYLIIMLASTQLVAFGILVIIYNVQNHL